MKAINAWTKGESVIFSSRDDSGCLRFETKPAVYAAFSRVNPSTKFLDDYRCTGAIREDSWYRITFKDYESRKSLLREHSDLLTYESDISPVKRLMADVDIDIQAPRRCFLDIETDSRVPFDRKEEARILSWALVDAQGKQMWGMLSEDTDYAEKRLLEALYKAWAPFDAILTWNGFNFDQPVIEARSKYHRLWLDRRMLWLDQMQAFKRMNLQVATSGEQKQSFALGNIATALLGEGKEVTPDFVSKRWPNRPLGSLSWHLWEAGGKYRDLLLKYMLKDAALLPRIEAKTGYLEAHHTICTECHIFPNDHALKPTAQADGWLLRYARQRGDHLPSKVERDEQPQFEGAYVMPPTRTGILRDVFMVDFSALYPSIIRTFGISHDSKAPNGACICPTTGVRLRTDVQGLIPSALEQWAKLRAEPKKRMKDCVPQSEEWHTYNRQQNVFKTLQNSLYGLLGSVYGRYYDPDLARSVTLIGVWLLKIVIEEAHVGGLYPVYADTDGVALMDTSYDKVVAFIKHINEVVIPAKLAEQGCVTNVIKLDFQEAFSRLIFPKGEQPAAKRFCGRFSYYDGKAVDTKAVEIKGLEVRRGDSSRLTRRMQQEVIDLLMDECEDAQKFEDVVVKWRKRITTEELSVDDIAISKSVKDLASYKSTPAHVRIAHHMKALGKDITAGVRIRYVVVDADVSPQTVVHVDDYKGDVDRRHLWASVYPPTLRLLAGAFDNRNWNRWLIKKSKKPLKGQLGLGI